MSAEDAAVEEPGKTKKLEGPVTIEQAYRVDGKRMNVLVTFPGAIASEIGMEAVLVAANRAIVTLDSKNHKIEKVR